MNRQNSFVVMYSKFLTQCLKEKEDRKKYAEKKNQKNKPRMSGRNNRNDRTGIDGRSFLDTPWRDSIEKELSNSS